MSSQPSQPKPRLFGLLRPARADSPQARAEDSSQPAAPGAPGPAATAPMTAPSPQAPAAAAQPPAPAAEVSAERPCALTGRRAPCPTRAPEFTPPANPASRRAAHRRCRLPPAACRPARRRRSARRAWTASPSPPRSCARFPWRSWCVAGDAGAAAAAAAGPLAQPDTGCTRWSTRRPAHGCYRWLAPAAHLQPTALLHLPPTPPSTESSLTR